MGYLLKNEDDVIRTLERQYRYALRNINEKIRLYQADEQTVSRVHHINFQKQLKSQIEAELDRLHAGEYTTIQQYLDDTYTDSFVGTMYDLAGQGVPVIAPMDKNAAIKAVITDSKLSTDLYNSLGVDLRTLKKSVRNEITRGVASGMLYSDIARNVSNATSIPLNRAKTIVRTEGHRIQEASRNDARMAAKAKGAETVKQWESTMDGQTRSTHRQLDGQIREVDQPFAADGKEAMYPGDFGDPAEDCNCRCMALTRARKALMNPDELKRMQERAAFFELDKTQDFEDFRQKYIEQITYMNLDETVKITKKKGEKIYSSVNAELVNSKKYHDKFEGLTSHKSTNESIYQEAMRILEHRDGSPHEDMVLIDSRTGKFITGNMGSQLVGKTGLTAAQYAAVEKHNGTITVVHNHPNNSRISFTDIMTMYANPSIDSVVAVCHDGSVQIVYGLNRKVDIEKMWNRVYNDVVDSTHDKTLAEHAATTYLYESKIFKTESR